MPRNPTSKPGGRHSKRPKKPFLRRADWSDSRERSLKFYRQTRRGGHGHKDCRHPTKRILYPIWVAGVDANGVTGWATPGAPGWVKSWTNMTFSALADSERYRFAHWRTATASYSRGGAIGDSDVPSMLALADANARDTSCVTVSRAMRVEAVFNRYTHLQVVNGIESGWYLTDSTVQITADEPPDNNRFIGWVFAWLDDNNGAHSASHPDNPLAFVLGPYDLTATAQFGWNVIPDDPAPDNTGVDVYKSRRITLWKVGFPKYNLSAATLYKVETVSRVSPDRSGVHTMDGLTGCVVIANHSFPESDVDYRVFNPGTATITDPLSYTVTEYGDTFSGVLATEYTEAEFDSHCEEARAALDSFAVMANHGCAWWNQPTGQRVFTVPTVSQTGDPDGIGTSGPVAWNLELTGGTVATGQVYAHHGLDSRDYFFANFQANSQRATYFHFFTVPVGTSLDAMQAHATFAFTRTIDAGGHGTIGLRFNGYAVMSNIATPPAH